MLLVRLAGMGTDLNIWLEGLSNWQFVAAIASLGVLFYAAAAAVVDLVVSLDLRVLITTGVIQTAVIHRPPRLEAVEMKPEPTAW